MSYIKHFVIYRHKPLSPSVSQPEELICILLWLASYCSTMKPPPGPTQSVCSMSSPTVCRTSNDFHLSCLVLYVFKLVSEGPSNVTLPHIPPVSHCYDPSIIRCIITLYSYHSACHCNFHRLCSDKGEPCTRLFSDCLKKWLEIETSRPTSSVTELRPLRQYEVYQLQAGSSVWDFFPPLLLFCFLYLSNYVVV